MTFKHMKQEQKKKKEEDSSAEGIDSMIVHSNHNSMCIQSNHCYSNCSCFPEDKDVLPELLDSSKFFALSNFVV